MKKSKVKVVFVELEDNYVYGLLYLELGILLINKNFNGNEKIIHIY